MAAFDDHQFIQTTKETIPKNREEFARNLSQIEGLHVYPSEADFLLVKIENKKVTATLLREMLAKEGMLIRDCSTFVGLDDSFFRVTVRSAEDNLKLVQTLKQVTFKLF